MFDFFKKLEKKNKILFTIIISLAVISFWRGSWGLMDYVLFPNNEVLSYVFSLIIGVLLLVYTGYATKRL